MPRSCARERSVVALGFGANVLAAGLVHQLLPECGAALFEQLGAHAQRGIIFTTMALSPLVVAPGGPPEPAGSHVCYLVKANAAWCTLPSASITVRVLAVPAHALSVFQT
jgi:hypothetical protein